VIGEVLLRDLSAPAPRRGPRIEEAGDAATVAAYRDLRHREFVLTQGLFPGSDRDDVDDDPRTIVLVARDADGAVVGGVRLAPATSDDVGWWRGSRLVVSGVGRGAGPTLVRAACARAEVSGVLRFDATVQQRYAGLFGRLGWETVRDLDLPTGAATTPHVLMRWPIGRIAALAAATKNPLGALLAGMTPPGYAGDDGAPVPGTDLIAACDAITPSMVERDPDWAGWCAVLVNLNDLAAMGAEPVGLLNAVGARDAAHAARILGGLRRGAAAWGIAVLGGHTQLGVPAALSATALGRTARPVPGGGGRPGHRVRLTADLAGRWRPGYTGRQWDSTSHRTPEQLRKLHSFVARARPAAAKDVSMAGIAGTLGMLAEASGCGAVLDVAAVPRPPGAAMGDWLTCFPGFGMLTTGDTSDVDAGPAVTAGCGELVAGRGVRLRWPDGEITTAVEGGVTGLGET
jgi:putative N-acetyltransferase (TIGR04045 family)